MPDHRGLACIHGKDLDLGKPRIKQQLPDGLGTSPHVRSRGPVCRYRRDAHQPLEICADLRQNPLHRRCQPLGDLVLIHARHAIESQIRLAWGLSAGQPRLPFRT